MRNYEHSTQKFFEVLRFSSGSDSAAVGFDRTVPALSGRVAHGCCRAFDSFRSGFSVDSLYCRNEVQGMQWSLWRFF